MSPSHAKRAVGAAQCPVPYAVAAFSALAVACAGGPEGFSPGRLDGDQMARCRRVAEAYAERSPEYPVLRDGLRDDPVAAAWFVRYLEAEIVRVREGQARYEGGTTVRADVGDRTDLSQRIAGAAAAGRASDDPEWRLLEQRPDARAADEIVSFGALAVPVLIGDLLSSPQEFLRSIGVELIGRIGDPAVPALLDLAQNGGATEQRAAARALGEIGASGRALEALRELCRSPVWRIRSDAAMALRDGGDAARAVLIGMLDDEDPFVRRKAAETLGHYRDPVAAGALLAFLERAQRAKDMDAEVAAQQALQRLADARGPRSVAAWRAFVAELEGAAR